MGSSWRDAFLPHPGLAVTPENYDRLLAAAAGPEPAPEPEAVPDPEPEAAPEPAEDPKPTRMRGSLT